MHTGGQIKNEVMPWAVNPALLQQSLFQVLPLVRATALDNKDFAGLLDDEHLQAVDLDRLSLAIVQVDQFFQCQKTHAERLRACGIQG